MLLFVSSVLLCCARSTAASAIGDERAALVVVEEHWWQQWSCEIMPFGISQHPPEKFARQSSVIITKILNMTT
jgi:hypothetical protein